MSVKSQRNLKNSNQLINQSLLKKTSMSKLRLEGKVAIITGAASGIGEAAARLFVENGARVVIADIQDELGHRVAASIGLEHASYMHCDVRDEKQVKETVEFALEKYSNLDIVFSNAGVMAPFTSILEMDLGQLDKTMATNVIGMASMIKHSARAMVARQVRGSIICTASLAAYVGGVSPHSYATSKHAVLGLMRSACSELGKFGIRINCISPYAVATPMACAVNNTDPKDIEEGCAALSNLKGIILKPYHLAEAALFLASDESSFISGHNLVVDGGFTVVNHSFSLFK